MERGDGRVGGGKIGGGVAASDDGRKVKGAGGVGDGKMKKREPLDEPSVVSRTRSNSTCKPRNFRQIDFGDLLLRLEVYCRT